MTAHQKLDSPLLGAKLKLRSAGAEKRLRQTHPQASQFFQEKGLRVGRIRDHAAKLFASGALASSLLMGQQNSLPVKDDTLPVINSPIVSASAQEGMATFLRAVLPGVGDWKLSAETESKISHKMHDVLGIKALPELDSNRLNNDYGRMGAEQHLPRFPGDDLSQHEKLRDKGITPGLGAWGYFAPSKDQLTPELEATEKWYVAVQTLYLPEWNSRTKYLSEWYKYRRVAVINPANGRVVIAAVADAGPADWTGKHFGGSPEVMEYLGINYGMQNHPVVLFFLDDPQKQVPLGPIEYNK